MSDHFKEASGTDLFFVALNELRPPFVIQLVLEGDGDPSPDALADALDLATAANPGCSLILDESTKTPRWMIGPPPTLTLIDAPEFTAASGDEGPFLMWPLDASKGPSCELLLVRGKTKTYLVFRALHAVMDGQGTLNWVRDVMRCLRGEPPIGHPGVLTIDRLVEEIDAKRRPASKIDALHPFGPADPAPNLKFHWRRIVADRPLDTKVSGKIAVALAERARKRAAGVVRINLPTDLRPHRPDERTTGNLFGCLSLEVPEGATVDGVALKIIQQLYKKEGTRPVGLYAADTGISMASLRVKTFWDLDHLHDTGRYLFSATLSHLGILKSAELSAGGFTTTGAFFVPLVGDSGCVVSVNGFDDHTEGAVGLSDRFCRDGQLDELASLIRSAIG